MVQWIGVRLITDKMRIKAQIFPFSAFLFNIHSLASPPEISIALNITLYDKVRPGEIVDKIVEIALNLIVPGRDGGKSWWTRGMKRLEEVERDMQIRAELKRWDEEFPFMHHQLIVRYASGIVASSIALFVYDHLVRGGSRKSSKRC